jgi:hypothetical protein
MNKRAWITSLAVILLVAAAGSGACRAATADRAADQDGYSAAALYNLGNSYARAGRPALAVLNYERAQILAPRDPDIRANLRQVQSSAGLTAAGGTFENRIRVLSPNTTYWLGLAGLMIAGTGWLIRGSRAPRRVAAGAAIGVGLLMAMFTVYDAAATAQALHEAVVVQTAPSGASPIAGTEPIFTEPAAATVEVQDQHDRFSLIRDPQGRVGWVARDRLMYLMSPEGASNEKN